jgi:hypothetical protein
MTASLKIQLTLADEFTEFDLFGPAWVVVKIGQRDDDYEPGYIAIKHSASISIEFDFFTGLTHATKQLAEVAAQTVAECLDVDKCARGDVSIFYDFAPPLMMPLVIPVESLSALASFGLPIAIHPHLDCWVETRESDGATIAKYERIIQPD